MIKNIFRFLKVETIRLLKNEEGFWGAVGAIAAILGLGISAYSSYEQGQAQSRMAEYNALISKQNADLATQKMELQKTQTAITEKRHRTRTEEFLNKMRTGYAKAGVETGSGTPLIKAAETAAEAEIDALAIRYAGSMEEGRIISEEAGYRQEATIQRMAGSQARTAGRIGAETSVLTGLGKFAQYKAA